MIDRSKIHLCNVNCNNCEAMRNKQVALLMQVLALVYGDGVGKITNLICPNLSCCPDCNIDDFCHWTDEDTGIRAIEKIERSGGCHCDVASMAIELAREFRAKRNKSKTNG